MALLSKYGGTYKTQGVYTSNGGCRREEKSRKGCSLFTMLLSFVIATFFFVRSN